MPISDKPKPIGLVAQPTSGQIILNANNVQWPDFNLTFTFQNARIPVTDAGASGSSGGVKIFDFAEGAVVILGARSNFTSFVEGSALTTGAGDAAFVLGVGTANATTARDGTLTGNEQNVGNVTATITNSGGTGTSATKLSGAVATPIDGTSTAVDLYLNFSGSAASVDANSYIDVNGDFTVTGRFVGDD